MRTIPPYGSKRDYRKIDLYEVTPAGMAYRGSTTWAHTCRFAKERYAACSGKLVENLRAYFDKGAQS